MTWEWRPLWPGETDHETLWAAVAAALAVMAALVVSVSGWPPLACPLRDVTGVPCPSCGTTRAIFALAAGNLGDALRWNPLAALAFGAAACYVAYAGTVAVLRLPRLRLTPGPTMARAARLATLTAVLANWLFLIADGR